MVTVAVACQTPAMDSASPPGLRQRLMDRLCARLGGWCTVLRGAHSARIPF